MAKKIGNIPKKLGNIPEFKSLKKAGNIPPGGVYKKKVGNIPVAGAQSGMEATPSPTQMPQGRFIGI